MARPENQPHASAPEALLKRAIEARAAGDMVEAAQALDAVLKAVPRHPLPLRLRARVALERGEASALERFDTALKADPGNADLHLGKAQALDVAGDARGAGIVAEQIAAQAPGFIEALAFLSSLYLARGEADFTAPFAAAARKAPQDPNIARAHCDALAGIERFEEAARIASEARKRFPAEPHFALLEASYAGSAGEWARAEAIFADLPVESLQRWLAEARHRLRAGDIPAARRLVDRALAAASWDVAAWALLGLIWRLSDTPQDRAKAHWLHEQAGLVQMQPLRAGKDTLENARRRLCALHESAGMPLNQSLRGGSQTRGILFHRTEPELAPLHEAILQTLEAYRAELPQADPDHPLLAMRAAPWRLAGSWSVRLTAGGDHHAAHIHPGGLVSSALYLSVPVAGPVPGPVAGPVPGPVSVSAPDAAEGEDTQGWLEIGRPPADLGLALEPLALLRPKEGHLALFPSTLYHGTRPFEGVGREAERLTVAFDVITKAHKV